MTTSKSAKKAWETRRVVRAISIRQPWAELIMRGWKVREFRNVPTNIRERVYVYASQKAGGLFDYLEFGLDREELPTGVLIGTVDVVDCEQVYAGDGEENRDLFAYVLSDPRRLRQPMKPENKPQPVWFRPFSQG